MRLLFFTSGLFLTLVSTLLGDAPLSRAENDGTQDTSYVPVAKLDSYINTTLEAYRSQGYWDTNIKLEHDNKDSRQVMLIVNPGSPAEIRNIHFSDVKKNELDFLTREFLRGAEFISYDDLPRAESRLSGLGYFIRGERRVSKDGNNEFHTSYRFARTPELSIDALAAFNQAAGSDTLAFFGHINLHVPNLDGKGKALRLNWKRLKTNSEEFSLRYEQPWLLNMPLKGSLGFGREVVDGSYQIIQTQVGLEWTIDWERSMILQFEDHHSLITHEGSLLNPNWRPVRRQSLGFGFRQLGLDKSSHRGLAMKTSLYQELNFEPSSVSRLDLLSEFELPMIRKVYLSQRNFIKIQNQTDIDSDPSTLNPIGGVNSVRGYEENVLRSTSVASLQHDLNLQLGKQSLLIALLDLGFYNENNSMKQLTGYGLGVQLSSGRGPIRIILATHQGLGLRNSFLHIEYLGGSSWIDR
jgi:outer membrane protein assembly factor BamA